MPKHTTKKRGDFSRLALKIYGNRQAKRHHRGSARDPQKAGLHPTARRSQIKGRGFDRTY